MFPRKRKESLSTHNVYSTQSLVTLVHGGCVYSLFIIIVFYFILLRVSTMYEEMQHGYKAIVNYLMVLKVVDR